tara:strand:- start:211 stop:537 length:327 start_codon:yes stop_codon:yes gene_type:complete
MKILEANDFMKFLEKESFMESKNQNIDWLTKEYLNQKFDCGCGAKHTFTENGTGIIWKEKLSGAWVLIDKNCDYMCYVKGKGIFSSTLKTIYSSDMKSEYEKWKKKNR